MKKLVLLFAAALMAVSVNAQTVTESKTFDNFYIGINGGVATKMTQNSWLGNLNPNAGLRIGRWFTPVFGLAAESNAYFSNKPYASTGTFVRMVNTSLLGTVNLSNWFAGYPGEPRAFEVVALYGLGWGHLFGNSNVYKYINHNNMTSKAALDFTFNFGANKAWQFYIEPAVVWGVNDGGQHNIALTNTTSEKVYSMGQSGFEYNINHAMAQLNAGIVYKFGNSNGTHNFKIAQLRDQAEIDGLNSQINDLRNQLAQKPKEVIKEVVKEAPAPEEVKVENLVFVTFAQGKAVLTKDAKKALDGVASGKHVQIVGTASPEGSAEINQKLSEARANNVAEYLKKNGVNVDEATGKGVQGTTSNRLAVVYVK
ncbi:MAG: OmpA family protein [Prevotella sp.]|jgi:OOP family OmpA-OmpF porin|nr:OmpA family protein [Prevotella sp.]MCI1281160.1 OmpA family protein [Prevotella sp.]